MISVIVPVYNTETFLARCINSILDQTYTNIELILIDDGSNDKSGMICDSYSKKDKRVCVIHTENQGVSAARNTGLETATGEYITFVDSDDWIEPDMYENMMQKAEEYDCDVVLCDCTKDKGNTYSVYTHDIRRGYYDYEQLKKEYYPHLLIMENMEYPATISNWLILYRVKRSEQELPAFYIRYVEGIRYSEDLLFGAEVILHSKSFYYMKGCVYYHYCMNDSSATHVFVRDKWNDYVQLYKEAKKRILCDEFDFQEQLYKMLLFFLYNSAGDIMRAESYNVFKKMKEIGKILNCQETKEMRRKIRINSLNIPLKQKVITVLYKYNGIYCLIIAKSFLHFLKTIRCI